MATYKEIKGFTVQSLASDLATPGAEGQIWFNTTGNDFKTIVKVAGTWASGGTLNTGRAYLAGSGTATAGQIHGGTNPFTDKTEQYDGTTWTEAPDLQQARADSAGFGTQTAAVHAGGEEPGTTYDNSEEFNGTSWAEGNNLTVATTGLSNTGCGSQTAGLIAGGYPPSTSNDNTQEYNGTSWTEVGDLVTNTKRNVSMVGTSTAAIGAGGYRGPATYDDSETWDGTTWTEGNNMNAAYFSRGRGTRGTTSAALVFGGVPGSGTVNTEYYDGTSWTEVNNLPAVTGFQGSFGTTTAAVSAGGPPAPSAPTATAEWSWSSTLQTGAWASGGNLPNPASTNTGFGPLTSGVHAGGELSGASNAEAFHYDGSSWTAGGNINTNRNVLGGYGTQTSGAIVGGHHPSPPTVVQDVHETYDGTTWSEAGDLQTARGYMGTAGQGTTTAALVAAGLINPELNPSPAGTVGAKSESEEYNGTSWAEGNDVNTARYDGGGAGTQTAALLMSGNTQSPNALKTEVEAYDGTSWTEVGDVNSAVDRIPSQCGGTQDIAIKISGRVGLGDPNPSTANVEQWDGTAWAEVANVSTARQNGGVGSAPSASSAFFAGGTPPATNATEEWTLAQNVKTITD